MIRSRILYIMLFIFAISFCACNKYIDSIKGRDIPVQQGFYFLYNDSNRFVYNNKTILTRDTERFYPKPFSIILPKKIRYYEFSNSSSFAFYYDNNQVITISIDLKNNNHFLDTIISSSMEEIEKYIKYQIVTGGNNKFDIKKIPAYSDRKSTLIKIDGTQILLYNIYDKNYDLFFKYVNNFKYVN